MWFVAVRALSGKRRRTILGVTAIALVVMLFILVQSVSDSFFRGFFSSIYSTEADVWVSPVTSFAGIGGSPVSGDLVDELLAVPGVEHAELVFSSQGRVRFGDAEAEVSVTGFEPEGIFASLELADGRLPSVTPGLREAVIDESAHMLLPDLRVGDVVEANGSAFTVVGISRQHKLVASPVLFVPISAARDAFGLASDQGSYALATVADGAAAEGVASAVGDRLGSGYRVLTKEQNIAEWSRQFSYMRSVLTGVSVVAFIIGALVMTLLVYISVVEKTREIGILKAIGATNRSVRSLVVLEAVAVAIPGFVIGAALGSVVASLMPAVMPIEPELPAGLYAAAAAITGAVAVLGSVVGMRRAVTVDPLDALRTV